MQKKLFPSDKIFIAGSTGMVGSSVKKKLIEVGYGSESNNGRLLTPFKNELNLLDAHSVNKWFNQNKPNVVILAAAKVGGINANSIYPAEFILENLKIQTNIIEAAWKEGARRLLFLGSSCIYPKYSIQPIKEESLLTNSLEPTNEPYAIAKIAGLKLCESMRHQYGFDAISVMPTNLYGPKDNYHPQNSHVMAALIRKFIIAKNKNMENVTCWGSGLVSREFMHVDDLANAIIFCLENWDPNNENAPKDENGIPLNHLNVGTGKDITIKDLAKKISDIVEFKGEILWDNSMPDGAPKKLLDVSRINKMGWEANIDLNYGIKKTIEEITF